MTLCRHDPSLPPRFPTRRYTPHGSRRSRYYPRAFAASCDKSGKRRTKKQTHKKTKKKPTSEIDLCFYTRKQYIIVDLRLESRADFVTMRGSRRRVDTDAMESRNTHRV